MFNFNKQHLYAITTIPSKVDPGIDKLKSKVGVRCTFDLSNPHFVPKRGVPYVVFSIDPSVVVRTSTEIFDYDTVDNEILDFADGLGYARFCDLMKKTEDHMVSEFITKDELPSWINVIRNLITKDTEIPVKFAGHILYFDDAFKFIKA